MKCLTYLILFNFTFLKAFGNKVPALFLDFSVNISGSESNADETTLKYLPYSVLFDKSKDNSEYWKETEILSLVRRTELNIDYEKCDQTKTRRSALIIPSRRTIRPICKTSIEHQLCPQCPFYDNQIECELFRDSCKERRVKPSEYRSYCDNKYGSWRAMFFPADYTQCRCCDECVFYRELDQSCVDDQYNFDIEEFLPITSIDFRAGCNPYWGHPLQELKALRCDTVLRRCVSVTTPMTAVFEETLAARRSAKNHLYKPPPDFLDCPMFCHGYVCKSETVKEESCSLGAFLPDKNQCNCCGTCSKFLQLNENCSTYINSKMSKIKEEFLEPGCDDGLVCRHGLCQDIHAVESSNHRRSGIVEKAYEPCKQELRIFKKRYGPDGHLHYNAPQCTPLWLYAPVQCRRFICYCALEDGTRIDGIKVPRVEVSNMNCDCARDKCRSNKTMDCNGYGNYKYIVFVPHDEREHNSY